MPAAFSRTTEVEPRNPMVGSLPGVRASGDRPRRRTADPSSPTSRIASDGLTLLRHKERLHGIVEDAMRLELDYRSDIDLSQPAMQVEIRNHIARCLRDYPHGYEGVITLAGVEHCFMYVVQDEVVDTVIGPPDYIEQVVNERRQNTHEPRSPLPDKEQN
jgi:hypothetical protein